MEKREKIINIVFISLIIILPILYYSSILLSNQMLFGTDWLGAGGYMKRAFIIDSIKDGTGFPLWNPNVFAGIPIGEGFWGDTFYPINMILKLIFPLYIAWTLIFAIHPIAAGLGAYLFIRRKLKNIYIAMFSAVSYMFTSVILSETYSGHEGRIIVACFFPLIIYFVDRALSEKKLFFYIAASLVTGIMLLSGHVQSSYYAVAGVILYASFLHINRNYKHRYRNYTWLIAFIIGFMFSFIHRYVGFIAMASSIVAIPILMDRHYTKETFREYSYLIIYVLLSSMIAAVQYLPLMKFLPEAARSVERGYAYATSWSMGWSELVDLFFPGFTGVNVEPVNSYWGANAFKLHMRYIGIIPMILALGSIIKRKKSEMEIVFTAIFFTGIVVALGAHTPLYRLFYNTFPYFNKFRAPELIFFITSFSSIILAASFLKEQASRKSFLIALLVVSGIGITILITPGIWEGIFSNIIKTYKMTPENITMKMRILSNTLISMKGTVIVSILLILSVFYGIYFIDRKYMNIIIIVLTVITMGDLWLRNSKFIKGVDSPDVYYKKDNVVNLLEDQDELYRVLPLNYRRDDYLPLHGIPTVSGQHPSPFYDYQVFVNNPRSVMFNPQALLDKPQRTKYLNMKYLVFPLIPEDTAGYSEKDKQLILYYNDMFDKLGFDRYQNAGQYMLLANRNALPRIFAVNSYTIRTDLDDVLRVIDSGKDNPLNCVMLSEKPHLELSPTIPLQYNISNLIYNNNYISFDIHMNTNGLVVLLDQYYESWECRIDGKNTDIIKAFGIFRAIEVEKGSHTVEFVFNDNFIMMSLWITILGLLIFTAALIVHILKKQKQNKSRSQLREYP